MLSDIFGCGDSCINEEYLSIFQMEKNSFGLHLEKFSSFSQASIYLESKNSLCYFNQEIDRTSEICMINFIHAGIYVTSNIMTIFRCWIY